jgi:hypothetical protein
MDRRYFLLTSLAVTLAEPFFAEAQQFEAKCYNNCKWICVIAIVVVFLGSWTFLISDKVSTV